MTRLRGRDRLSHGHRLEGVWSPGWREAGKARRECALCVHAPGEVPRVGWHFGTGTPTGVGVTGDACRSCRRLVMVTVAVKWRRCLWGPLEGGAELRAPPRSHQSQSSCVCDTWVLCKASFGSEVYPLEKCFKVTGGVPFTEPRVGEPPAVPPFCHR